MLSAPAAVSVRQGRLALTLFFLALLAFLPYLPALKLPFIADDYLQISLARKFVAPSGWGLLASDALYRCRATSLAITWATERLFGLDPFVFNVSSALLHVLNTWLIFLLGSWRFLGWRVSFTAAAVFAVYEGHQEAVIWYSALPELLVFFFVLAGFLAWLRWIASRRIGWWAAALGCFVLALLSKESAMVAVPLMAAAAAVERVGWRRIALAVAPFALLCGVYAWMIFTVRSEHLFFHDGTFDLSAPFVRTILISTGRLLWFWGVLALLALVIWRSREHLRLLGWASFWILVTFLPYSFLTYMPRVPSRHTYFASLGLAWVVALALLTLKAKRGRYAVALAALVMVAHNCGYVWTRKMRQFEERAAPTEMLLQRARRSSGPVRLHCFPYGLEIAELALDVSGARPPGSLLYSPKDPTALCVGAHHK